MALSFNIKILTGCILIARSNLRVSDRQRKRTFAQECFYLQGIFSYMNERDTSFDCKYKHMLEKGAPPDKFGVLYDLLHIEFHGFDSNINVLGLGL